MDEPAMSPSWSHARARRDQTILESARHGDRRSFERLYDELSGPLLGYLMALLPSGREAELALEESMITIATGVHEFDPVREPLIAWAVRIARTSAATRLRLARARDLGPGAPTAFGAPAGPPRIEFSLPYYLRELPVQEREVIFLRYALRLSDTQIAGLQGTSKEVVCRVRAAALEVLADRFDGGRRGRGHSERHSMHQLLRYSPVVASRRRLAF